MKRLLLSIPLLFAYTGAVGTDEPLTFWWYAGNPAELRPAIECALERIRAATCLPVDVSLDAAHWVRQKELAGLGQTTGASWSSTRIALQSGMGPQTNCRVLTHEIAQHVLRRSNDHVGAQYRLDQPLIDSICAVQSCGCSNPETSDNPVESTQGTCP